MIVQLEAYPVGKRIRIARGILAGLTGAVAWVTDDDLNCVLTIDDCEKGVYVAISDNDLVLDLELELAGRELG